MSEERKDVLGGLEGFRPGPWRKIRRPVNGNDDYWEVAWSDDGELVADGVYGENVDLIARAPELVEEIRRLRGFVTKLLDAGTWFHSAIELHTHDGFDGEELEHEARALLPPTGDSDDQ